MGDEKETKHTKKKNRIIVVNDNSKDDIINCELKTINGVKYKHYLHKNIIEFRCDQCNKKKKSKDIVYYKIDREQRKLCNGCYENICSSEQKELQEEINEEDTQEELQDADSVSEDTIWGNIIYQCLIHNINIGKLWGRLHLEKYDDEKKGVPILDKETYHAIITAAECSKNDLICSNDLLMKKMTELLLFLLKHEAWYQSISEGNIRVLTININGDRMSLSCGAHFDEDDDFKLSYIPTQEKEGPPIPKLIFDNLLHIKNKELKEQFYEQIKSKAHTKKIIYSPTEKFAIGKTKEVSLMDLFLMDYDVFVNIKRGNLSNVSLAPEIVKFFDKCKPFSVSMPFNDKQRKLLANWETFNRRRKNRMVREVNEKLIKNYAEQCLINATIHNEIQWVELLNTRSQNSINRKYECSFDDLKWEFNVIGYKKGDEWKANFTLTWNNKYGDSSKFGGDLYALLYKEIERKVMHKEKKVENLYVKQRGQGEEKPEISIDSNDFIIRTNLFRCYHKDHLVEEIIGVVDVVTSRGEIITKKVSCAYCPKCHCFFILYSQFKRLNEVGIVLCQLIESDKYYRNGKLEYFNGNSESLLMMNGYNVKANIGLTEMQRHIILQNIMDKKIMSAHRICSYLDMFIAQKRNMPQYKQAIEKWEKDKQFILAYNDKEKRIVEIKSLKK